MTEQEADLAMEALHRCRYFLTPNEERALLKHLYELHKHRDHAHTTQLLYGAADRPDFKPIYQAIVEMVYA